MTKAATKKIAPAPKYTAKKSPAKTSKAKAPAKAQAPAKEGKGRRADEIVKFLTGAPKRLQGPRPL